MWLIQLILAWLFLYIVFRLMVGVDGRDNGRSTSSMEKNARLDGQSSYLTDAPDGLRPDIEEEFDPTEYLE